MLFPETGHRISRSPSHALICLGLVVLIFVCTTPGFCTTVSLEPVLEISQTFNNNIGFSKDNRQSDHITIAAGSLSLKKITPRLNASVRTEFKKNIYHRYDGLNSFDKDLDIKGDYKISERLSAGGYASWSKAALRGNDVVSTGLALNGDQEKIELGANSTWLAAENSRLNVTLDTGRTDIEERDHDETNDNVSTTLTYIRTLANQTTQVTAGTTFALYDSQQLDVYGGSSSIRDIRSTYDTRVYQARAGVFHSLNEMWQLSFQAGFGYTDTTSSVPAEGEGRMKALMSVQSCSIRVLSPRIDPPVRVDEGSTARTATL